MVWRYIEEHIDDQDLFDILLLSGRLNPLDSDQGRISYELKTRGIGGVVYRN